VEAATRKFKKAIIERCLGAEMESGMMRSASLN
jgi:hypothetical protein